MNRDSVRIALARFFETPIARALSAVGISPNMLTLGGLMVAGGAAYLVSEGFLLVGGIVLLASGPFDMLDGAVARVRGQVSRFGAVLDSTADRVAEAGLLTGLAIYFYREADLTGVALAFGALAGSMTVSYLRARGEGLGVIAKSGLMTRPERVVTLGVGLMVAQWWDPFATIVVGVIAGLTILTSMQRLIEIKGLLGDSE
jgi:CDP-diacylglycerol--glycerol-3-phosphate 3-phosphatidyltransferase